MSDFSIGDAVGSGFGVISRRPLSVLAWAVVYLLLVEIPRTAHMAEVLPSVRTFLDAMHARFASGARLDLSAYRSFSGQIFHPSGWLGLSMLGHLLASAILAAAIYRAVLEPDKKGFASLRLGAQELWLVLLNIVACIVLFVAAIAIGIGAGLLDGVLALATQAMSRPANALLFGLLAVLIALGAIAVFLWICIRLSLAGPLTFKERQFRLFESWTLTKGHSWKLFGLALLLVLVFVGLEIVLAILGLAGGAATHGAIGLNPLRAHEILDGGRWWPPSPWVSVGLVIQAIVAAGLMTIFIAPWATAFREFGGGLEPEHPAVF